MAVPNVFVSSTCYDLAEERAQLERFIASYGFQPILSEYSGVFYDPDEHTHEACVNEVANCDLFVLIISGRFGGEYKSGDGESITQAEYNTARKLNIPVFAFVKKDVQQAQLYYKENVKLHGSDFAKKIIYPAISKQSDSTNIFNFLESVEHAKENNAIESYNSFIDIENHLRKQWAGLFYKFISSRKNQADIAHISTVLDKLTGSSATLEFLVESLHESSQGQERTQEIINQTKTYLKVETFFSEIYKYISLIEDRREPDDRMVFTELNIEKIANIDPVESCDVVHYLKDLSFIEVSLNEYKDSEKKNDKDRSHTSLQIKIPNYITRLGLNVESEDYMTLSNLFETEMKRSSAQQRKKAIKATFPRIALNSY